MKRAGLILLLMISSLAFGKGTEKSEQDQPSGEISKAAAQGPDIAYAILNKGELVNCYMNFGEITDSYFQTDWYNFMWPKSKGAIASNDNATDDISFMFARKGNVIDGFTAYRQEDWSPVPGSWGRYHAKGQPDALKYNDYPHLAASDIPATWPEGYDDEDGNFVETPGVRHWPGDFRLDINPASPTFGQEVENEFPADRVVYSALDDHSNLTYEPLGIRLDVQIFEYGRPYASDFQFYEITITNTSDALLDSCYWGYYYDIDYGEYEDEAYFTYNSGLNPGDWDVIYELDPDITDPNEFERGVFGLGFLKTPKDLGITDHHYYLDTGPTTDELLFPIMTSDPTDPNIATIKADYFHGSNVRLDESTFTQTQFGFDWVCLTSTGPFDLNPGESVKAVVVVCAGDNVDDFKMNINMAKGMLEKGYQGPSGPKAPKLSAVGGDKQVTLYWTDTPEHSPDPYSGEYDFEGYQIFRSRDGGQSWGKEILDGFGSLVGYVPVAQFDLDNTISGLDPLNANFNLGNNSGIAHSWVDMEVENGVEYAYTIIAYDRGDPASNIQSFSSSKGGNSLEDNFVTVMPKPNPLGYVDPSVTVNHQSGYGKGTLKIEVLDPSQLTDHAYQIAFIDSPATDFMIIDVDAQDTILAAFPVNTSEMPVLDGFRIQVTADESFGKVTAVTDENGKSVQTADNPDSTGSWYVDILPWPRGGFDALTSDYEIRFTNQGSRVATALSLNPEVKETVPFEVWNVTYDEQVSAIVIDDGDLTFEEGEQIYIVNIPYSESGKQIGESYSLNLLEDIPIKLAIMNTSQDLQKQIPVEGQQVHIFTTRAFTPSDMFSVTFSHASVRTVQKSELDEIRVVPNPYVVNAAWEVAKNVRQLQFMYLPPECVITIFTTRGELVRRLNHNDGSGILSWNMTSESGQDLAYGIYIYIVKTPEGKEFIGKFALIK